MVQYYTLEQAAKLLRISAEQLKEMARKKEIRAFQDRSGWRFRAQEIDEMARERGFGSDPELPLGEAAKAKPGDSGGAAKAKPDDSGGKDVFNFSLDVDESDEVPLGKTPSSSEKSSRSGSPPRKSGIGKSPPPKASSDSDVRLVLDSEDLDFGLEPEDSKPPVSKAPASPPPKVGSSKSRVVPPFKDDSGVRIVPLDQPSDSDVKIAPSSPHDSDVPVSRQGGKTPSDSDIRIEGLPNGGSSGEIVTEEIDLDAEQRKADAARSRHTRHKPKPGSSSILPTRSPFELSENDLEMDGPTIPPPKRDSGPKSGGKKSDNTDSSSDFELKPMADSSSPLEPSSDELPVMDDDEVGLGELTGGKGASGINLQDPADSGISLEQESSDEMQFELSLDAGSTPKPAPAKEKETDSSSDFELSLQDEDASPNKGSSSEFELSLQEEDASPTDGSSSEFELSLDADGGELAVDDGSSDLALETPGSDSDSEFELTLDEGGGLSVEEEAAAEEDENVFETDFEVPALDEESGSEAVALDEADTNLESSEFDLSLESEGSGSQVVPLEDEEEADEGAATVQRKAAGALADDEEGLEDIGEALDDDLNEEPVLEDEEEEEAAAPVSAAAAAPAEWGAMPALVLLPCTILLFVVGLMSFELIQGMWGYHTGNKVSHMVIHPIAKLFDDSLPDN